MVTNIVLLVKIICENVNSSSLLHCLINKFVLFWLENCIYFYISITNIQLTILNNYLQIKVANLNTVLLMLITINYYSELNRAEKKHTLQFYEKYVFEQISQPLQYNACLKYHHMTNGSIICEFHRNKPQQLYSPDHIINEVIDHSRKLVTNTYDKQLLHLTVTGMQIYYRAYQGVLFITILASQYDHTYLYTLFDMIISEYLEQAKSIFKTTLIPNRLSKLQQARLKMLEPSLAIICRNMSGKSLMKTSSINDTTHRYESQISYKLRELDRRQEDFNTYKQLNKTNPMTYQYRQNLADISIILLCKKLTAIFLFIFTIFIGIYIIKVS